jgi:CheY-like chemotaxis protein
LEKEEKLFLKRRIDGALNGFEALDLVKKLWENHRKFYNIIFMDCNMPKMDGYECTMKIREFIKETQKTWRDKIS